MFDFDEVGKNTLPVKVEKPDLEFAGSTAVTRRTVEETYDALTKKIYVVDKSNSMESMLLGLDSVDEYDWTPEHLDLARQRIRQAQENVATLFGGRPASAPAAMPEGDADHDDIFDDEDDDEPRPAALKVNEKTDLFWASFAPMNDELLRAEIVAHGLGGEIGLRLKGGYRPTYAYRTDRSKMAGVKKYAKQMVEERFAKYPDADVHLIAFDGGSYYAKPENGEHLLAQIESLEPDGGDTKIAQAIHEAIKLCELAASPVNVHHIILVSDALDAGATDAVRPLVMMMKAKNIVLDFIHVLSPNELVSGGSSWEALKRYCEDTGGTYTRVDRAAAFRDKFVQTSRKVLLLGPPDPKKIK